MSIKFTIIRDGRKPIVRGGCSCGRNQYLISLPTNSTKFTIPQVLFDDSFESRKDAQHQYGVARTLTGLALTVDVGRAHATPLPALLRVPLVSLRSSTYAFFPDETHAQIRRVFTPHHDPMTKRHFCGFCGTTLTSWSEAEPGEADWIRVNLGSLENSSLLILDEMNILPSPENEEIQPEEAPSESVVVRSGNREIKGQPWFEEIIKGSHLGRLKRRRGGETSKDGSSTVEWEIVEFDGEEASGESTNGKRKIAEIAGADMVS